MGLKSGIGLARPGWLIISHETAVMLSARTTVPTDGSNGNPLPSSLTWLLAGFSSAQVVGVRGSIPQCLLTGVLPRFLASRASPCGSLQHSPWLPSQRERAPKIEATIFCNLITLRGRELYKGMNIRQQQSMGTILEAIYIIYKCTEKNLYDDGLSLGTLKMMFVFFLRYWPFLTNK